MKVNPEVLLAVPFIPLAQANYNPSSDACSTIARSFVRPGVAVNFAQQVAKDTNITFPQDGALATCQQVPQTAPVELCRISLFVETSQRSNLTMEAWLPSNWTGRFLSVGNGGLNGCIKYEDLAYAVGYGFAAVGTNNGHNGTSGRPFYYNPEVVTDFAYRAMHTGVVVGKQLIKAFYGRAHTKSYYLGCSTGGRQGFKSAQEFPGDFDGIVAGAPALAFPNLTSWSGRPFGFINSNKSANYLTPQQWTAVTKDVLRQCDGLDGAVDGILETTELCHYNPSTLLCPSNDKSVNSTTCLTAKQVQTVRNILSPYYGEDGSQIFARTQPGVEGISAKILYSGSLFSYSKDYFEYIVYSHLNWDPTTFTIQDAANAAKQNPDNIMTWNGDLSPFKARGGKLLHYHGTADQIITSENSPRYYNHVVEIMGQPPSELDEFYRFFRISGMNHCSGGPGAWQIGQSGAGDAGTPNDAQHNVLLRMIEWVEKGDKHAPETITGIKYINDTVSNGIDFVRNHCKYPLRNQCIDAKNHKDPKSWKCVA